jgi:hypothetical protein
MYAAETTADYMNPKKTTARSKSVERAYYSWGNGYFWGSRYPSYRIVTCKR